MRRLDVLALLHLVLLAAICVAVTPSLATAQPARDEVVVLVDETFDNPNAGEIVEAEGEEYRQVYERGAFVVEGIGQQFTGLTGFYIDDVVADGTIAVNVRLRGTVEDRPVFLSCRDGGNDVTAGYMLRLDLSHGDVVLLAQLEGEDEYLTDYIAHDAIFTGNRTNRLELSCIGSTITATVNDVEVVSVTDDRFQRGQFSAGVGVFNDSPGPAEAVFDNLLVSMVATPDASARQDARAFDQFRATARESPSLFGPAAGEIRYDREELASDRFARVDVRDVYARATFVNPYDVDEQRWSVGIAVRDTGRNDQLRIVLRSNGRWYLVDGGYFGPVLASGPAREMATAAGAENTIDIAVVDETGYLALNGGYLATFDASARMTGGDVWIGAALFEGDNIVGDRTAYHDFEVWGLGDDAAPAEPPDAEDEQPRLPAPRDESVEDSDAAATVTVDLHDMDQSGRTGQATLTAEDDQTKIALRVRDVPGDTLVVLQEGPCTALDSESGLELHPLNDAGVSVTRIDAELDALLAESHAIVVYDYDAEAGFATLPLVCGEIAAP